MRLTSSLLLFTINTQDSANVKAVKPFSSPLRLRQNKSEGVVSWKLFQPSLISDDVVSDSETPLVVRLANLSRTNTLA
jgi:hypothetical protein